MDTIGVGRVMIKAMRYWATVLGIASEGKDQQGIYHTLTPLANVIAQNDLYCSDRGRFGCCTAMSPEALTRQRRGRGHLIYLIGLRLQKKSLRMRFMCIFRGRELPMCEKRLKKNLTVLKIHM